MCWFAELGRCSCVLVSNVYLLLNYGDFTDDTASSTASPYAQILSTTNAADAHADFVATRLNAASQHNGTASGNGTASKNSNASGCKGSAAGLVWTIYLAIFSVVLLVTF